MKLRWWHFGCALVASIAIHAIVDRVARFDASETVREQGFASTEFALLGSALENMIMEGDTVEPEATQPPPVPATAASAAVATTPPPRITDAFAVEPVKAAAGETVMPRPVAAAQHSKAVAIPPSDSAAPIVAAAEIDRFEANAPMAETAMASVVEAQNTSEAAVEVSAADLDALAAQPVSASSADRIESHTAAQTADAISPQAAKPVTVPPSSPFEPADMAEAPETVKAAETTTAIQARRTAPQWKAATVEPEAVEMRKIDGPVAPAATAEAIADSTETPVAVAAARPVAAQAVAPVTVDSHSPQRIAEPAKTVALIKPIDPTEPPAEPEEAVKNTGDRGTSGATAARGIAAGRQSGSAASAGKSDNRNTDAGNAEVSNYPGKVRRKLRRSLRYPRQARSARIEGAVVVGFTVAGNGSVTGVRVVEPSGHRILDSAAIATVERAAPFAEIPAAANRSSWTFEIRLEFVP